MKEKKTNPYVESVDSEEQTRKLEINTVQNPAFWL